MEDAKRRLLEMPFLPKSFMVEFQVISSNKDSHQRIKLQERDCIGAGQCYCEGKLVGKRSVVSNLHLDALPGWVLEHYEWGSPYTYKNTATRMPFFSEESTSFASHKPRKGAHHYMITLSSYFSGMSSGCSVLRSGSGWWISMKET